VRTGDVIVSVDGAAPFTDGYLSPGVFYLLYQSYPQHQAVRITLRWPVTGATRTVTITPAAYPAPAQPVTSKLLDGHIGYLQVPAFNPGTASGDPGGPRSTNGG
jgi:carboxyl-terminal processing protease